RRAARWSCAERRAARDPPDACARWVEAAGAGESGDRAAARRGVEARGDEAAGEEGCGEVARAGAGRLNPDPQQTSRGSGFSLTLFQGPDQTFLGDRGDQPSLAIEDLRTRQAAGSAGERADGVAH